MLFMTNTQLSFNFEFFVFYLSSFWKRWLLKIIISIFLLLFFFVISLKWHSGSSASALVVCFFTLLEMFHLYMENGFGHFFLSSCVFYLRPKMYVLVYVCQSAHFLVFTKKREQDMKKWNIGNDVAAKRQRMQF